MENLTIEHIIPFVEAHRYTGYALLFLAMVLEGEIFLIVAGMLVHLGAFDFGDVYIVALAGVVAGNALWYFIGKTTAPKPFMQKLIARAQKAVTYILPNFIDKPFTSVFFSKFIYGINRATVFLSGAFRVRFSTFMEAEFLASIIWVALYASLGYFAGYAAIHVTHKASSFALLILFFVVGFIVLRKLLFTHYARVSRTQTKEDHHA